MTLNFYLDILVRNRIEIRDGTVLVPPLLSIYSGSSSLAMLAPRFYSRVVLGLIDLPRRVNA